MNNVYYDFFLDIVKYYAKVYNTPAKLTYEIMERFIWEKSQL